MAEISVRVTPRSSKNSVEGWGPIRVKVTAAPTDGQANEAVRQILAKTLKVAPTRLTLIKGHSSRDKVFKVDGLRDEDIQNQLQEPQLPDL